jgi:hypothetical protein
MVYTRAILTGYVLPLLNAFIADSPKCGSQIACDWFYFNGLVTHVSKFASQAT